VNKGQASKTVFFLALILVASGLLSPALALLCGIACGLFNLHPYAQDTRSLSRHLLQASVVALGFGMNLHQVIAAGRSGIVYTALSITVTLGLGFLLGWLLRIHRRVAFLVSVGTAICGGSAIAAVAPILAASQEEIAMSLGAIFLLNSVALLVFPPIGTALHLTQNQFGLWSALAIHDTSSVVGAAAKYGTAALAIATTVKLARALWIVPVSIGVSVTRKSGARVQLPWFILFFLLAAAANTFLPIGHPVYDLCRRLGLTGLTVTLFLIGAGLSVKTLRAVGPRPLLQGILLWIAVATGSLLMIRANWIQ
jgi:uncharacterized integral membrane protein (TIGR00698 family)